MKRAIPVEEKPTGPSDASLELAAQCWCDEETKDRVMDIELCKAFAKRLDEQKLKINVLVLKERERLTDEYRHTIKHTGGLLTKSMVYAYSRAINDIFKLLNKTEKGKT